jgi:hypothetical protein
MQWQNVNGPARLHSLNQCDRLPLPATRANPNRVARPGRVSPLFRECWSPHRTTPRPAVVYATESCSGPSRPSCRRRRCSHDSASRWGILRVFCSLRCCMTSRTVTPNRPLRQRARTPAATICQSPRDWRLSLADRTRVCSCCQHGDYQPELQAPRLYAALS